VAFPEELLELLEEEVELLLVDEELVEDEELLELVDEELLEDEL
jgi:hypothetical protein